MILDTNCSSYPCYYVALRWLLFLIISFFFSASTGCCYIYFCWKCCWRHPLQSSILLDIFHITCQLHALHEYGFCRGYKYWMFVHLWSNFSSVTLRNYIPSTVSTFSPPRSWCLQWGTISFTELYFDRGNFYDFTSLGEFLVHDMAVRIIVDLCNVWTCDLFFSSMLEILKYRLVS